MFLEVWLVFNKQQAIETCPHLLCNTQKATWAIGRVHSIPVSRVLESFSNPPGWESEQNITRATEQHNVHHLSICEWSCSVTSAVILKKHLLKQTQAHDCTRLGRHEQRKNMTKEYRKRSCGIKLKEVKENFMSFQRQVPASPFCVCICSLRLSHLIGFLWVSITARTVHHLSHVSWNPSHSPLSFPLNSLDYFLLCSSLFFPPAGLFNKEI